MFGVSAALEQHLKINLIKHCMTKITSEGVDYSGLQCDWDKAREFLARGINMPIHVYVIFTVRINI